MSDKKDKGEPVTVVLLQPCDRGHNHPVGVVEGTLYRSEPERGETIYEDKNHGFVGGGSPQYAENYDQMNWN